MGSNLLKVMFDTNVFNHICDGTISAGDIPQDWAPVATHVQKDEIAKIRDPERLATVQAIFERFTRSIENTSGAIWGYSKWGCATWPAEGQQIDNIQALLSSLRPSRSREKQEQSNARDSLILETCRVSAWLLVTNDQKLIRVANTMGVKTIDLKNMKARHKA